MCPDKTSLQITPTRDDIVNEAFKWEGVTWRHQGRNAQGLDCAGLVIVTGQALGLMPADMKIENYRREPLPSKFLGYFDQYMTPKRLIDRKPGDVLLFRDDIFTCHAGIYHIRDGQEWVLHAYALRRAVVDEPYLDDLVNRVTYCYAYNGID